MEIRIVLLLRVERRNTFNAWHAIPFHQDNIAAAATIS